VSDGPVFLQRERPACAGQQLISGPLTNVMEEPAVELPLLDGPEIRKIMSRQLESYGINILKLHAEWLQANGYKPQASSLTAGPGDDRMDLERNNYGHNTIKKNSRRSGGDPETSKARYGKV